MSFETAVDRLVGWNVEGLDHEQLASHVQAIATVRVVEALGRLTKVQQDHTMSILQALPRLINAATDNSNNSARTNRLAVEEQTAAIVGAIYGAKPPMQG